MPHSGCANMIGGLLRATSEKPGLVEAKAYSRQGEYMQPKTPDLAGFLAGIPDEGLSPLKASLSERANTLAGNPDDESRAWVTLYRYMVTEIECASLLKLGVAI